jgi:hypothetical protein
MNALLAYLTDNCFGGNPSTPVSTTKFTAKAKQQPIHHNVKNYLHV